MAGPAGIRLKLVAMITSPAPAGPEVPGAVTVNASGSAWGLLSVSGHSPSAEMAARAAMPLPTDAVCSLAGARRQWRRGRRGDAALVGRHGPIRRIWHDRRGQPVAEGATEDSEPKASRARRQRWQAVMAATAARPVWCSPAARSPSTSRRFVFRSAGSPRQRTAARRQWRGGQWVQSVDGGDGGAGGNGGAAGVGILGTVTFNGLNVIGRSSGHGCPGPVQRRQRWT